MVTVVITALQSLIDYDAVPGKADIGSYVGRMTQNRANLRVYETNSKVLLVKAVCTTRSV
jgi:hypothetical protein